MLTKLELEDLKCMPYYDIDEQWTKAMFAHIDEQAQIITEQAHILKKCRQVEEFEDILDNWSTTE